MSQLKLFKYRHYQAEIILLCVRCYCTYGISYRDLTEMMRERRVDAPRPGHHRAGPVPDRLHNDDQQEQP